MRLLAVLLSFQIKNCRKKGVEVLRSRYFFLLLSGAVLLFFGISRARQMQAGDRPSKSVQSSRVHSMRRMYRQVP